MLNTFQSKVLKFESLTKYMIIPEFRRNLTKDNVIWLKKNLEYRNKKNKNLEEAMSLINELYEKLYKSGQLF